eukprot:g17024.t1
MNASKMNLVFFKDAQEHLARASRIIRQPRGCGTTADSRARHGRSTRIKGDGAEAEAARSGIRVGEHQVMKNLAGR